MTTYREGCGTHAGLLAHKAKGEESCGECLQGEQVRRAEVEAWPSRVAHPLLAPVTPRQAAKHRAALLAALDGVSESRPG